MTTIERGATQDRAETPEMMPGGIALSATLHVAMAVLIVFGLPNLFRKPPPQETPIAVQLVTIAPETRATQPNPYRPKPEAKPEPPVAAPAPKPEPKPEPPVPTPEPPPAAAMPPVAAPPPPPKPEVKAPPAPPPPPPKPIEAQAPPLPPPPQVKPTPKPEPQTASHPPKPEPKKVDPAAFSRLIKELDEKKAEPAAFDSLLKNLTKHQAAPVEDAPPTPRRTAALSPPSSQPKAPLGSQLTASELDALKQQVMQQLTPCWHVPAGARDAKDLSVQLRAAVNLDGTVRQAVILNQGRLGEPLFRAAAESARRTFFDPKCTPLRLPADKYEVWKDLVVNFDPKDLL